MVKIKRYKKHRVFFVAFIVIVNYFLFYRETYSAANETILRNENSFMKIKELNESSQSIYGRFNHPYHFTEKELTDLFSQIFFQEKGMLSSQKTIQVFSAADLSFVLSPLLVTGFEQLKPTQYLLVYNSLTRSYVKNKHNYFCLFVVGQNLYIVFSRIHHELTRPYTDEENIIVQGIEFENPMSIKKGALWKLSPVPGQSVQPDRENTLIIPLRKHESIPVVAKAEQKVASKKPAQEKESDRESTLGFATKSKSADKVAVNDGMKQAGETSHVLKEHLRLLKSLFEEKLISNEDYEKRKNELLDNYFEISAQKKD